MTVSAVSHYRGGTIDVVTPLAKTLKAVYLKYGVPYRPSRFETGPNVGDWLVVVQYADMAACEKALATFTQDPEWQQAVTEISKIAKRISRELVVDLAALVCLAFASGRRGRICSRKHAGNCRDDRYRGRWREQRAAMHPHRRAAILLALGGARA